MLDHQPWREHGKCASLTPEQADKLFYLSKGQSSAPAKAFCSDCPVRKPCLFFALFYKESGIWAGTTDKERLNLYDLVIAEVEYAMSVTYIETRDISIFLAPQEVRSFEGFESEGWNDERLVS